jgi:hypothetical protein
MLIELLVVMAMLMVVVGATLDLLQVGTRTENRGQQFANEIADGEAGLARMAHEIRQASSVTATTPNSIDFLITIRGQARRVFYECDVPRPSTAFKECVRLSAAAGTALPALGTAATVISRIANGTLADPVFGFSPDAIAPTYIDVRLELPAAGELTAGQGLSHNTVLDSGIYLRNLDVGA